MAYHPLKAFYQSVYALNPTLAAVMSEDVLEVALNNPAFGQRSAAGQTAANNLRQRATYLPEELREMLDQGLLVLGYG